MVTEIELISYRYDKSTAVDALRVFKALFDGVFINCIIIASVTLAMSKIIGVILGLSPTPLFDIPLFGEVTSTNLILIAFGPSCGRLYRAFRALWRGLYRLNSICFGHYWLNSIGCYCLY